MRLEIEEHPDEGLRLTPLIDVVFLLLVFFLVATTFADDEVEMDLQLPEAATGEPKSEAPLIVVSIRDDGTFHVDGRMVSMEGLQQKLRAMASGNREREVLIRGDTTVQLGLVTKAMDACRAASLRNVSIAAQPVEAR